MPFSSQKEKILDSFHCGEVSHGVARIEDLTGGALPETSTASLVAAFLVAISSKRFHAASRLALILSFFDSFSSNWVKHSSNSSGSRSQKILRTFMVKLWTAWFQWFLAFFSSAGKIIGSMTLIFCLIRFSMWSLFHRNKALSATWNGKESNNWSHEVRIWI